MRKNNTSHRNSPIQILIHLLMAPRSGGTYTWQLAPDQLKKLAEDARWIILRRIFPELGGKSPYKALLQKHAIKVEGLDVPFFCDMLEVIRERHSADFNFNSARDMDDVDLIKTYFIPSVLEWAENERSTSVSREKTPSIEDLVMHEDSCGNTYQRFPEEFSWAVMKLAPGRDEEPERDIPADMKDFVRRMAVHLTDRLKEVLQSGKLEKYVVLMARLEDDICTWEMTWDYLNSMGMKKYSSWKSLSVVANRAMKEYVDGLPDDVKSALHQDDPELTKEEKHDRLRLAVTAALEINPLPTPQEILAEATA